MPDTLNDSQSPAPICQYFGPRKVDNLRYLGKIIEKTIQYLDHPEPEDFLRMRGRLVYDTRRMYDPKEFKKEGIGWCNWGGDARALSEAA